eukprot:9318962-Pyramimonas_sp.AAC.1
MAHTFDGQLDEEINAAGEVRTRACARSQTAKPCVLPIYGCERPNRTMSMNARMLKRINI